MSLEEVAHPSRLWLRRLALAAVVLIVGYLGAMFAFSRLLDPERLADWAQPRIAAAVHRDVEIGAAAVRLIPFEVRLQDVAVSDPTGLATSLASVRTIALKVRLLPLLRRQVQVDRVSIVDPIIDMRIGADGASNFGDLSPATEEEPGEGGPVSLELRSVRIEGGRIHFARAADSLDVMIAGAEARSGVLHHPGEPWVFDGDASGAVTVSRAGRVLPLDGTVVELGFSANASDDFQALSIERGTLGAEGIAFTLTGSITALKEPVRRLTLDATVLDLPLARVVDALPDSLRERLGGEAEGRLSVELHVRGEAGPETRPEVTGLARLEGGRLTRRDGQLLAESVSGRVALTEEGGIDPTLTGRVLGGEASIAGRVTLGEDAAVDLSVEARPRLDRVASLGLLPEGASTAGDVHADVRVTGPARALDGLSFDGTVTVDRFRVTHPRVGVPIEIPSGVVRLAGSSASIADVPVVLGNDRIVVSGAVRDVAAFAIPDRTPYLTGSVQGRHLSLAALRAEPPADTALTYGRVAFARVGGRTVRGVPPEDAARAMGLERPDSLPLAGTLDVSLDELEDRRGTSADVRATVEFGPRFVRVTDATLHRYGGEVATGFDLTLGATPSEPFTLRLRVLDVDAGAFLAETTPLGALVRGRFTAEVDLTGSLDALLLPDRPSLVGTGRFRVTGGGLNATPVTERLAAFLAIDSLRAPNIRDWETSFVLDDGTVRLADAVVEGAPGTPTVGGGIGLDGGLDLLAAFALPLQRLDASALERLGAVGEVANRVRQRDDVLQAVLRIGGDVLNPALRADPTSPGRTLANAVQEEAQSEAQKQIAERRKALEERATGFLRGLVERRDTARAAPDSLRKDSLPGDSIRPDTLRRDTVPPDTVPRDTVPRDTIPVDTLRHR